MRRTSRNLRERLGEERATRNLREYYNEEDVKESQRKISITPEQNPSVTLARRPEDSHSNKHKPRLVPWYPNYLDMTWVVQGNACHYGVNVKNISFYFIL
ncbi:hypothetical protein RRG08_049953 [Elysia crispata]|uniref:Uncharacterized protein n=1 Tax=Elysia crispata TaxID=231223 RepID=A0AAE0YSM4_9GAST|nr:hypothetical protein RRG08_049953 [Elysia crispata]